MLVMKLRKKPVLIRILKILKIQVTLNIGFSKLYILYNINYYS